MIEKVKIRGYRIYRETTFTPSEGMNIIVGGNQSGKSTLVEAITLALTGRINGKLAQEELNPHWFNTAIVREFLDARRAGQTPELPTIEIEIFLKDEDAMLPLSGAHHSVRPTTDRPGMILRVVPDPNAVAEIDEWFKGGDVEMLPIEYYNVEWCSFRDQAIARRPKQVSVSIIDSSTVRSSSGIDYHLRQLLSNHLEPEVQAKIALDFRKAKHEISGSVFKGVNAKIAEAHKDLHDQPVGLLMDQSARTRWENSVAPHVGDIPFSFSGQGQQASIKIALAMSKESATKRTVIIEEPENHLSHTSLTKLIERIEDLAGEQQQLFITTHSSFVLNRLGLDALTLVSDGAIARFEGSISADTIRYFKKLPGYDTLRVVLAERAVVVEGPSDEILFERWYSDLHGKRPIESGADVISARGLSYKRFLELAKAVGKKVAVVRDNDDKSIADLEAAASDLLESGVRQMFIGAPSDGKTLEPQILTANPNDATLRTILGRAADDDLADWMDKNKTEAAIRIAEATQAITPPAYMKLAANFIHA